MKTALYTMIYLNDHDGARLRRAMNFVRYYQKLQAELGFEKLYISDNGSNEEALQKLESIITIPFETIRRPHIPRGQGHDYLPCWRNQYGVERAINDGFKKVIVMDDDAYLLSKRVRSYVKGLRSGWTTFWCPKYQFPEVATHILCEDTFPLFREFIATPYEQRNGKLMEWEMPCTNINKNFNMDRYGETNTPQLPEVDGYFQCSHDVELK